MQINFTLDFPTILCYNNIACEGQKGVRAIKNTQRRVYKIPAAHFAKNNWDMQIDPKRAIEMGWQVALFDSQMFRLIEQIRNRPIKPEEEILIITFSKKAEWKRANAKRGVKFNGKTYKRFVGTTGGLKMYSVMFANVEILDELNQRCEGQRNQEVQLVPAKYEAYKALTTSASVQIPAPSKILVVSDVETTFKDNFIKLDDTHSDIPVLERVYNYELTNNATDGFSLCTYDYAKRVSESLDLDYVTSGFCLRHLWYKGMCFPFPIEDFIEQYADNNYIVKDIWGNDIDVHEVELITTESSLKLWKCYQSIDDYTEKAQKAGYQWAVTKVVPEVLEDERAVNYQYLQDIDLTDEQLHELCRPTIDWLTNALCGDIDGTKQFLGITDVEPTEYNWSNALYYDDRFLQDDYVIKRIKKLIAKKIQDAKIGKIKCHANYQIVSGDCCILMQHIFGLPETGLLKSNELYSSYWHNEGVEEVLMFRSPMIARNNIRKAKIVYRSECDYWYRYMKNIAIINSFSDWQTALSGMD